jgi:DNA-binding NtrC family response regulator
MVLKPTVLIVDDEKNILISLSRMLDLEGFVPVVAGSARIANEKLQQQDIDAVLLDVRMPEVDGLAFLRELRAKRADLPVIMMSGHSGLDVAIEAIQAGAHDFIEKPVSTDRLLVTLNNALSFGKLKQNNRDLQARLDRSRQIVGDSTPVTRLREEIELAAPTKARVLITGENGTGKELVAHAIHQGSPRAGAPFIKVNCAAIPSELIESELFGHEKGAFTGAQSARKGKFEQADGGTLFLDEIGDMRLEVQVKLLRVLQEGEVDRVGGSTPIPVDVRVIAATNKDLPAEIEAGEFREDLYYRINVIPVHVPALRDRKSDLPLLVEHFLSLCCEENGRQTKSVDNEALAVLAEHGWPGNIRELRNICERLVILTPGTRVTAADVKRVLPGLRPKTGNGYTRGRPLREMVADAERALILSALEDHGSHITNAAQSLGLERSHLYKKMKALNIR